MEISFPTAMRPHIEQVLAGEYDVPGLAASTVLDVGANVGSFAVWAARRWPGCEIRCYEPMTSNFEFLVKNTSQISGSKIDCIKAAVGDTKLNRLYFGKNNCGECSLYDVGEQTEEFEEITVVPPTELPIADVLKLDVEGSESYILKELANKNRLDFPAILLEYHGELVRREVDQLLSGYLLVGGRVIGPHRGILKYIKI